MQARVCKIPEKDATGNNGRGRRAARTGRRSAVSLPKRQAEDSPYQTAKKSAREVFAGAHSFDLENDSIRYGLVVVVVVVSSCLITAGAWGRANTTFRTTTRSPTVE